MEGPILKLEELESFLQGTGDQVFTYLKKLSRDPDLAADLSQTVLLKFVDRVGGGQIRRPTAMGYLIQMAKNEYFQLLRKNRELPMGDRDIASDSRRNKIESDSSEIHSLFIEAIHSDALPEEVRDVLRMRFLEELEGDEIVRRVGKSKATVHRLMRRGLDHLFIVFEKAGFDTKDLA